MAEQPSGENATAGLEPNCANWTTGNCSAASGMIDGTPGAWMIASLMLYGLICAAGTVGNGLVIYVVLRFVSPSVASPEFCSRGGMGAWRTVSEVRGDKFIQK